MHVRYQNMSNFPIICPISMNFWWFFLERLQRLRLPPDAITLKKYYIPSLSVFVFSLSLSLPLSLVAFSLDLRNEKFLFFCDNFLLKHFSALSGHPMTCTFSSHFFLPKQGPSINLNQEYKSLCGTFIQISCLPFLSRVVLIVVHIWSSRVANHNNNNV